MDSVLTLEDTLTMTNCIGPAACPDHVDQLQRLVHSVAVAGREVYRYYDREYDVTLKKDRSKVSTADYASHDILCAMLARKGVGLISEEAGSFSVHPSGKYVVFDPLDGTSYFIKRMPSFSVMAGFLEDNQPVAGAIYFPMRRAMYFAVKDGGAFCFENNELKQLRVSDRYDISDFRLLMSGGDSRKETLEIANKLGINNATPVGSIGLKFAKIARGDGELYISPMSRTLGPSLGVWDCCAPQILLKEAGGDVYDVDGNSPLYVIAGSHISSLCMAEGVIASNAKHKNLILDAINSIKSRYSGEVI